MNTTTRLAAIAALLALAGCADPRVGPNSKTGWVTEFYTSEKLRTAPPKCLAGLTPAQIAERQYAEITVPHFRSNRRVSAAVPSSLKLQLHDKVEITPPSCQNGMVPEVVQVLKRSRD
jgi:hypothetical protein